jgi:hypothetical protein
VKAWKAALAAAIATAAIALIVIAPMAQSSKSRGRLKVTTVVKSAAGHRAVAKCPRGYVVISGGFDIGTPSNTVIDSFKLDDRRWVVDTFGSDKRGVTNANSQAICVKGARGFKVADLSPPLD